MVTASVPNPLRPARAGLAAMALFLFVVLSILLYGDYLPQNILYSNDGPLGRLMSACHRVPDRFTGCWEDLNLLGMRNWGSAPGYYLRLAPPGQAALVFKTLRPGRAAGPGPRRVVLLSSVGSRPGRLPLGRAGGHVELEFLLGGMLGRGGARDHRRS